jgi:polar amino acid transport system substrate-binding protein
VIGSTLPSRPLLGSSQSQAVVNAMQAMTRFLTAMVLALAMLAASPMTERSQPVAAERTMDVAVRVLPPFVVEKEGKLTGFSVDLWNDVAARSGWKSSFTKVADVQAQLLAVRKGAADVGVGAVSITAERATTHDFSQPILNAGLQIMVRSELVRPEANAWDSLMQLLFSPAVLVWIGIAMVLSLIPAHIVWWLERGKPEGMGIDRNYYPGIFQAFYWGLSALAAQSENMPRHWIGRILALFWMFAGMVFVALYTAQLTASLTVERFRGEITGPEDLPGKKVATVGGSTSERYLVNAGVPATSFGNVDEAAKALLGGAVEAVVYDAPVLQYLALHASDGEARTIGAVFNAEDYGFVVKLSSPLRKQIDAALLAAREDGTYDRLREKWFGQP